MNRRPGETGPGWGRAGWRGLANVLVPFLSLLRPGPPRTRLESMRLVFSMVAVALPMLLFVVVIVLPWTAAQPVPPAVWALLALGVASLGGSAAAGRRPLPCGGPKGLVRAYQQRLFLGIAFAEAPAMLAFVAAFVAGAAWPYLVGVGTAAPGLARVAPTDGDVARKDAQLSAGGCATSLREALLAPKT